MRVVVDPTARAFADRVLPWLLRDPVRNNVAALLIQARADGSASTEDGARWLAVLDGDQLAGVALRLPPQPLLLTMADREVMAELADWCAVEDPRLPVVNGPVPAVDEFARRWTERTGAAATVELGSRVFRLDQVTQPAPVSGGLRLARPDDVELLYAWVAAFHREAAPYEDAADLVAYVDQKLAAGLLFVWQDGDPATMLWTSRPAAGVVRISAVYTPPERRGHGYASALVAAVSQRQLDHGATACCLYTDLSNPTSNKIYQAIGYQPVQDVRHWRFGY
jgi:predicted GNAT family acetyltransferase